VKGGFRSSRLRDLPPYLFEELAAARARIERKGADIIDLSIGDPEQGAPEVAVEALTRYASDSRLHCYTPGWAVEHFNSTVCRWMKRRFSVELDAATEIIPLIGTKEGIAHLPLAVLDPGELALVPDPSYPVYSRGVRFAGGRVEWMPLEAGDGFLPDVEVWPNRGARIIFLNYPNNPTSAVAGLDFYKRAISEASKTDACVVNDAAYSEVAFEGYSSPSILEVPDARDIAIEFHSFSKTFSMAGWRVGYAAGSSRLISALKTLKSNIDSGVFGAVLMAASHAIEAGWQAVESTLREYGTRRSLLFDCLTECRIGYHESPATLYIWARVPTKTSSMEFSKMLLDRAGVLVAPGIGFGEKGEGYFRISITCPTDRIKTAVDRLREVSSIWKD
jgi:LL-diaminopimelate aminotransferase